MNATLETLVSTVMQENQVRGGGTECFFKKCAVCGLRFGPAVT